MPVPAVPEGYHTVTPYLIVSDATRALTFYREALGADEVTWLMSPDGTKVMHAEIRIGNSMVMLADEFPEMGMVSHDTLGGNASFLHLYLGGVDACYQRAIAAGCEEVRPVTDQFYGDRSGILKDPFGHQSTLSTHIEDLSQAEMAARFEELMKSSGE